MATTNRLPTPGGDDGQWGQLLNDFLSVEHGTDGTLKIRTDGTLSGFYTKPVGGIPETDFDTATKAKVDSASTAYQMPVGGIPSGDLSSAVQTTLGNVGNATKIQGTNIDASAPSDGQVLVYSQTSGMWVPNTATSTVVSDATTSTKGIVQLAGNLGGTASSPTVVSTSLASALPVNQGGTGTGSLTGIVKGNGTGAFTAAVAADFPTLNQDTTGNAATATSATSATTATTATAANGLKTATTTVVVNGATAPSSGQVLTATSSTAATWQTPASGSGGGIYTPTSVKTSSYVANNGELVLVDNSAGISGFTVTLPAPSSGGYLAIKKVETSTNGIVPVAPSGSTVDGGVSGATLNNAWQSTIFISNGTDWYQF
jgi:hypothetical protein